MQPIPYDVRSMWVYRLDTTPRLNSRKGYADKRYNRSERQYRMYFRPTMDTQIKEAQGQTPNVRYRVVINQHMDISLGDRIGTENPEFEVTAILTLTNPPQHQLEVKRI